MRLARKIETTDRGSHGNARQPFCQRPKHSVTATIRQYDFVAASTSAKMRGRFVRLADIQYSLFHILDLWDEVNVFGF